MQVSLMTQATIVVAMVVVEGHSGAMMDGNNGGDRDGNDGGGGTMAESDDRGNGDK